MMIEVLKSKLHCVTVTEANLHYMGSITIDEDLMDAAGLIAGEKIQVVNNNNGERFETYVIKGERGSGCICLNGAAARKVQVGDVVIIGTARDAENGCRVGCDDVVEHRAGVLICCDGVVAYRAGVCFRVTLCCKKASHHLLFAMM